MELSESTSELSVEICAGEQYQFGDNIYTAAGIYEEVVPNSKGCDSTITLDLIISDQISQEASATICAGESYLFGGNNLTDSGIYEQLFTATAGCDSLVTLNLEVMTVETSNIEEKLCNGQTYILGNSALTTSGVYTQQFTNRNGCDSMVILNLTLAETIENEMEATICEGESYEFAGNSFTESGIYEQLFVAAGGCDSLVLLDLTVETSMTNMMEMQICLGETYSFNNQILDESGTLTFTSLKTLFL